MNRKTQKYTNLAWVMGGRGAGLIPLYTSPITINTFYVIVKGRADDLLTPTSTYFIINPTITSYIVIKTIVNTTRINIYTQQSTMVTWVMGGRVAGMGPISTSPITINSFLYIASGIVDGIF